MAQPDKSADPTADLAAERLVRYADLRPCTTAFIDTRTPGSAGKENFTIIGPGVAESAEQHVHIDIPHGFNIGGARQPPGCVNSQHSHETAEVFIVHAGRWAFCLGPNREDGEVELGPGDVISIPVHVFRGFRNIGDDIGFLFAILGGDDPGRVTWAPYVFDAAKEHGLVLLDDGTLIDTSRGETIPEGRRAVPPTTDEDVARLRRLEAEHMADCVVTHDELSQNGNTARSLPGIDEFPIIGAASPGENLGAGKMAWPHGFHLRHIAVGPGACTKRHIRHEEEVIFVHTGTLTVGLADGKIDMVPGDTLTVPIGMARYFANDGDDVAEAYIVRGGDHPRPADDIN